MSDQPLGINVSKREARKLARAQRRATAATRTRDTEHNARAHIKRAFKVAVLLILINYLGLPALAGVQAAVKKLSQVEFGWLALGVGLQFAALLAYTQLMRVALPPHSISLWRLFRIQLSTKAVNNVVPGGSAAGAALGYRLLTTSGIEGPVAGFALAATGLISAVVLNLLFWTALLISMPFYGFKPLYITASLLGLMLLVFSSALALALVRGEARAEQVLRRLTRRFKRVDPERISAIIQQVAGRLRELLTDRELVRNAARWATLNWLFDAASLFVFIRAFGTTPSVIGLMVAFGLANILAVIPITPGGLGVIEPTLTAVLRVFGVNGAAIPVSLYRIAQFWLPIPLGAIAYLTVRTDQRSDSLADVGRAAYEQPDSRFDWAEEYGHRPTDLPSELAPVDPSANPSDGPSTSPAPSAEADGEPGPDHD